MGGDAGTRGPEERRGRWRPSPGASFWILAVLLGSFLFAASAPSPLYGIYAARFGFKPVTVTAIYAVYALGALIGLLVAGRLSDHLGRRPVVGGALVLQIAGMALFIWTNGVASLYAARALQGLATGVASAAISAWMLDLQPADNPRLGGLVGGIAPLAGLGTGALGAGLLVQFGPEPLRFVFWLLAGVYAVALLATAALPDVVPRSPGWLASMRPRIGIPPEARRPFAASAPSLVAIWALAGLYLSLGPALAIALLGTESRVAGGLVIFALCGVGAAASAFTREMEPRSLLLRGSLVVLAGVGVTLGGVALESPAGLYAGTTIAGVGFGPAFTGIVRSLAPLAGPENRNALFAAIYLGTYASFSVPAILAGIGATEFGLLPTTFVYGAAVMALAATTAVLVARRGAASAA